MAFVYALMGIALKCGSIAMLLMAISMIVLVIFVRTKRYMRNRSSKALSFAFFHPYCNDGGGGERVLWCAVLSLLKSLPNGKKMKIIIYSGDETNGNEQEAAKRIIQKASARFNLLLPLPTTTTTTTATTKTTTPTTSQQAQCDLSFVFLKSRTLLEARHYPVFTMICQSLAASIVGLEALIYYCPDVFFDSMGYSFTYPIFSWLGGCKVGTYTHYPTISTDMLAKVNVAAHNNRRLITAIPMLSYIKKLYYQIFGIIYGMMGRRAEVVVVNSSWTASHLRHFWRSSPTIIYPPCNSLLLQRFSLHQHREPGLIMSIAQFRPEKNHKLQLEALSHLLHKHEQRDNSAIKSCKLVLAGSCRNAGDEQRVAELKRVAQSLNIEKHVRFALNVPFAELCQLYETAEIGLHSMWCEHFGIGVVELMAAGVIVIAHNSAGPKQDIVTMHNNNITGYLAETKEEYANKMAELLLMDEAAKLRIKTNARESVSRFSDETFFSNFAKAVKPLLA